MVNRFARLSSSMASTWRCCCRKARPSSADVKRFAAAARGPRCSKTIHMSLVEETQRLWTRRTAVHLSRIQSVAGGKRCGPWNASIILERFCLGHVRIRVGLQITIVCGIPVLATCCYILSFCTACMHTYTHAYVRKYIHNYIHAYTYTHTHTYTDTCTHIQIQTQMQMRTETQKQVQTQVQTQVHHAYMNTTLKTPRNQEKLQICV